MSAYDVIVVIMMVISVSIAAIVGWTILDQIETSNTAENWGINNTYIEQGKSGLEVFNGMAAFLIVGLGIGVIASAFLINTHPIFAVVGIILIAFQIMISALVSNTFIDFANSSSTLAPAVNEFGLLAGVMQNAPTITMIIAALALIVTYGKTPMNQNGQL